VPECAGVTEPRGPYRFADRMTDLEALMWRLGARYPGRGSTMTLVVAFEGKVPEEAVGERLASAVTAVPRLRARVSVPALPMTPPCWEPDPDFDLSTHLRRASVAAGGPLDLLRVAADVVSQPLAIDRPPWRAVFVPTVSGPDSSGSGLVLHLHHSYTDGVGGLELAASLFDMPPGVADQAGPPEEGSESAGIGHDVAFELEQVVRLAGRLVPWAARSFRDPVEAATFVSEAARFLRDQLQAASGPTSPIMSARSARVALSSVALSLDEMRRVGRLIGTTVNDVFLSGLLGGLALYHEKHGALPPSLRVGIPMSTRPASGSSEPDMHNQLFAAVIRGPLAVRDPDERTRLVHEIVSQARGSPLFGFVDDLAGVGRRLPRAESLLALASGSLDLVASNVPGPPQALHMCGVPVAGMIPFGPRSGAAVNATLLSYSSRAHVGLNVDLASVPDLDVFIDCVRGGFEAYLV
jgi:diacylglycerol O-acyltransferase